MEQIRNDHIVLSRGPVERRHYFPKNGPYYFIVSIFIIIFMYSLGRFVFFDLIGLRRIVQVTTLLVIALLTLPLVSRLELRAVFDCHIIFLSIMAGMLIIKGDLPVNWLDMILSVYFILIINNAPIGLISAITNKLVVLSTILSILGMILFISIVLVPSISELVTWPDKLDGSQGFIINNLFMLMGSVTDEKFEIFEIVVPRLRSFVHEPSLIPAYFGVSLAFSLIYRKPLLQFLTIALFMAVSLSGSVYSFLTLSIIFHVLLRYLGKEIIFYLFVIICFMAYAALITYIPPIDIDALDENDAFLSALELANLSGGSINESYSDSRNISGLIRLSMLSWGIQSFMDHPIFGPPKIPSFVYGLFIYSFVNAGIVGLCVCLFFARRLFYRIHDVYNGNGEFRQRLALSLIAGLLAQAFAFNDYGITTTYGMIILAIIYRILGEIASRSHNSPSELRAAC